MRVAGLDPSPGMVARERHLSELANLAGEVSISVEPRA